MARALRRIIYTLLRLTKWDLVNNGGEFYWQRYDAKSDTWVRRPATEEDRYDAIVWWSMR